MSTNPTVLKGLFDRPINTPIDTSNPVVQAAIQNLNSAYQPFEGDPTDCPPGYLPNAFGGCDADPYSASNGSFGGTGFAGGDGSSGSGITTTIIQEQPAPNVNVTVPVNVIDTGIQQISDQLTQAINNTNQQTQNVIDQLNKSIVSNVQEESDSIQNAINNASTNLGDEVKITTAAIAASTAATEAVTAKSITDQIDAVKNTITPILSSIQGFIDKLNADVQAINDGFVKPLLTLYNTTVGEIATLTADIERDLKDGISGLLQLPGQVADELASFDATLNRTVEELGKQNLETVKSGIDYQGAVLPKPFSDSFASSFGGTTKADAITTTFTDTIQLTSESLQQVSAEAIGGLGTLLKELLHTVSGMFESTTNQLHGDWKSVDSIFVALLDGLLGLLTTVTAMGALATPLISAAEQEAQSLAPTRKLDPSTVIEAMKRKFLDAQTGIKEMSYSGLDATRQQVLQDLAVFLADVPTALDWWYRGIISDADLTSNMSDHGITDSDQKAIKDSSVRLPGTGDLIRWLNFGIINQDTFSNYLKMQRYDDSQIQAILSSYQDHETPNSLSQLTGLLNNSNAGFISSTLNIPVPDNVQTAGARANFHPDLVRYIWLAHWNIPGIDAFIQSYFRGFRTQTEVFQRMAMENIPQELWQELIDIRRPLLPLRTIPSLYSKGLITYEQASTELQQHGHNAYHIQLILQAYAPKSTTTQTTAANQVHTLSQANAKLLWSEGAITDDQYEQLLVAHGYTPELAAAQLAADQITEHIKQQKQTLADTTNEVQAGILSLDDATNQLQDQGFSAAQIATFQNKVIKSLKANSKHPTISDMKTFFKAGIITIDDVNQELQIQGWQDPWLSAWLTLFDGGTTDDNQQTTAS